MAEQKERGEINLDFSDTFQGSTGEFGALISIDGVVVADLFSTPIPIPEGSAVVVEERLSMSFDIDDEISVDLDKRWFGGRPFLGTYRLQSLDDLREGAFNPEREGFLSYTSMVLEAESRYLVVRPLSASRGAAGNLILDSCNLVLGPEPLGFGVSQSVGQADSITSLGSTQAFKGIIAMDDFPIARGFFREKISAISFYLNKGVSLVSLKKRVRIGGLVESLRPAGPVEINCSGLSGNCGELTESFFAANPTFFRNPAETPIPAFGTAYGVARVGVAELAPGCAIRYYELEDVLIG